MDKLLGGDEDLALINAAKLRIDIEILFVEPLVNGVEQAAQRWGLGLLDDLGASLLGIVLSWSVDRSTRRH